MAEPCLLESMLDSFDGENEDDNDTVTTRFSTPGDVDSSIGCINYVNGLRSIAARHKVRYCNWQESAAPLSAVLSLLVIRHTSLSNSNTLPSNSSPLSLLPLYLRSGSA